MRPLFLTILLIIATNTMIITIAQAQDNPLNGIKICLDPGHGGHDSNDRQTDLGVGTFYYESDANWEAVGYLDSLLQSLGAVTKLTKLTNDPEAPDRDPSLSDRVQVANAFGADYFHSFHTNGAADQTVNYSLVLYPGPADGEADFPESVVMAEIMADELFKVMRTTSTHARADIPFTGYTNGLGVLNNLNMPGTLSEASFHSNLKEGRRLMNSAYLKNSAWSIVKSFLKFYDQSTLPFGEVGGIVTDNQGNPLNEIEITFAPGTPDEAVYIGDLFLNGFYLFDRVRPGTYEVRFEKFGYEAQIKSVTVQEGLYTEVDASLSEVGGAPSPPALTFLGNPGSGTGVSVAWLKNPETTLLGYRLYYATDDSLKNWVLAADENMLTAETTEISIESDDSFLVQPSEPVYHFKLTAVTNLGAESEAADIYSRSSNTEGDKILIVDGFDRTSGSFTNEYHDFVTDYFNSIRDVRIAQVHTAANEAVIAEQINLENYEMVVWFLGDESTISETFSKEEQDKVSAFLNSGGKFFVSGSEIAWDLDNKGDSLDRAFLNNYLKASFVGDGSINFTPATGKPGTTFEGLSVNFGIAYPEDYPDDIAPENGAVSILDYSVSGAVGGIAYKGLFPQGTEAGGLVYISFPLETANPLEQKLLMKNILSYLDVGSYYTNPPAQPILLQVASDADGVLVDWEANIEITLDGYRLYYATDNTLTDWKLVANEATLNRFTVAARIKTEEFIENASSGVYYLRMTAVSEGGFESALSDTYAASNNGVKKVLIVDGFDRVTGSYTSLRHNFAASYHQGIFENNEFNISTAANEKLTSDFFDITAFDMVYWFLGDESTVQETFSSTEQGLVKAYLEQGGKLFVSGSEVGWDLFEKGNATDKTFFSTYLKSSYVSDGGSGLSPARGLADTDFSTLEIGFGEVYAEDFPDEINANEGSTPILAYITGTFAGIAYTGPIGAGTKPAKLVYFAFPLETAETSEMNIALQNIIAYFEKDEQVTGIKTINQNSFNASLYPNPTHNTGTTLELNVGETAEMLTWEMVLLDVKGQEHIRKTLHLKKGLNRFDLEISDLKSGIYFIQIYNKEQRSTLKLLKK